MITEYRLEEAFDVVTLMNTVNSRIKDGWSPQGGVSVVISGGGYKYTQVIIKTE
jgi:hypothetical protein